ASGDAEIVQRIKSALEKARVDVFLDTEQLHAGNAWDAKLRMYIEKCSLFVPIISRRTLTPDRRYFRKEWNLALEEAEKVSFSPDAAFLLPVIIDDTPINHPDLPARFAAVQSEKLLGGEPTEEFVARVRDLYRAYQKAKAVAA
ncbi:MAG: toll/interleukin-1 receptor domain-containing protein, partial [Candidatus Solibacter sp.]